MTDNQTTDSVTTQKGANVLLKRLRKIVADHLPETRPITKNLNFFSTVKKALDRFKRIKVKEASSLGDYEDQFAQDELEFGVRKPELSQSSSSKKRSKEIFNKKSEIKREKLSAEPREMQSLSKSVDQKPKISKAFSEAKSGRAIQTSIDGIDNGDCFDQNVQSIEPKDLSCKTLTAFESYLSQVSMMYFSLSSDQGRPNLNDLSMFLSSNKNAQQNELGGGAAVLEARPTESRSSSLISNYQYSTLDVL